MNHEIAYGFSLASVDSLKNKTHDSSNKLSLWVKEFLKRIYFEVTKVPDPSPFSNIDSRTLSIEPFTMCVSIPSSKLQNSSIL